MDSETRQHQSHHYHVFLFCETLKRFLNVLDFRSQSEITPLHWKTLWQFFKNKHNNKNTTQLNRYLVTQQFHPRVCIPESWRRVCAHERWTAVLVIAVRTRSSQWTPSRCPPADARGPERVSVPWNIVQPCEKRSADPRYNTKNLENTRLSEKMSFKRSRVT